MDVQPSVVSTVSKLGMNLLGDLHSHYAKDTFFHRIVAAPQEFPHFQYMDGLLYKEQAGTYLLCILDVCVGS